MKAKKLLCMFITLMSVHCYSYVKKHVATIKKRAATKSLQYVGAVDCRGADLSGIHLAGVQLSNANFGVADKVSKVSGVISIPGQITNLSKADFSGATLISTNFAKADLRGANFTGANILNANFSNADLTGAIFADIAHSAYAVFCGATMPDGTKLTAKTWKSKSGQIFYAHCPKK